MPARAMDRGHATLVAVAAFVTAVLMLVWVRRTHGRADGFFGPDGRAAWVSEQALTRALSRPYTFGVVQAAPGKDYGDEHHMDIARLHVFSAWPGARIAYPAEAVLLSPQENGDAVSARALADDTGAGTASRRSRWTDGALYDNYVRVRIGAGHGFTRAVVVPAKPLTHAVATLTYEDESGARRVLSAKLGPEGASDGWRVYLKHDATARSNGRRRVTLAAEPQVPKGEQLTP
jgi:hypothetical protein